MFLKFDPGQFHQPEHKELSKGIGVPHLSSVLIGYDRMFHYKTIIQLLAGWWLSPTPLKHDGVRQLG
jgi:hypothetical protein